MLSYSIKFKHIVTLTLIVLKKCNIAFWKKKNVTLFMFYYSI